MKLNERTKSLAKVAKERIDPRTTGGRWKKIRNIAGLVAAAGGLVLIMPLNLPAGIIGWVQWGVAVSTFVAGGSNLDRSGK